jgi:hypothetical protein
MKFQVQITENDNNAVNRLDWQIDGWRWWKMTFKTVQFEMILQNFHGMQKRDGRIVSASLNVKQKISGDQINNKVRTKY